MSHSKVVRKSIARVLTVYNANIRNALKNKITEDAANKKGKVGGSLQQLGVQQLQGEPGSTCLRAVAAGAATGAETSRNSNPTCLQGLLSSAQFCMYETAKDYIVSTAVARIANIETMVVGSALSDCLLIDAKSSSEQGIPFRGANQSSRN